MFKATATNPYDEIVVKTTDETLTGENWELILNLCDKVQDEGETGARNVIAAILKRLTHRNANVQLYTLTLAESLSKNCGLALHRELASKAFTAALEKLITDRTTHDKVRNRALGLIEEWKYEFESNTELGIMEECYNNLKTKNYKFDAPVEPPPVDVEDEIRRKEEEELQRVLELSVQDKGGRPQWAGYSLTSSEATGSKQSQSSSQQHQSPPAESGYVPASAVPPQIHTQINTAVTAQHPPTRELVSPVNPAPSALVTRVRALHSFEPTEAGELAFDRGDIIRVVDRGYKDWWRGQLRGRTGIFPVNYVEPLAEPTPAELAREAEQEASVFSKAADVDRLLNMLKEIDPAHENLADNEDIQELYRSCMALRPKIVKLIDKYSQKRADLVTMNETFVKARSIFDQMMEESIARHSQGYEQPKYGQRPTSVVNAPQGFGWNQPGYNAYPQPGYTSELYNGQPPNIYPQPQPAGAYPQQPPRQSHSPQPIPYGPQPQPLGVASGPDPSGAPYQQPPQLPAYGSPQAAGPPLPQIQPLSLGGQGRPPTTQSQPGFTQPQQQPIQPQPQPRIQAQPQSQVQPQPQPQPQPQIHPQLHIQTQPQIQPQPQAQPQPQNTQTGPPYTYDPNMRYADSNVQAWAQYYAQGGQDPTGAVYFISVPGVKEPESPQPATATTTTTVDPNPEQEQPLSRRQSLLYNPHGAPGTNDAGDDLALENPYDRYGLGGGVNQASGAGGTTGPGYGASPYYGLTRDMAGMDIKG
ncbi:hypothetical protein BJ322DRAFT_1124074 [Thelephora terrestris]|uniref:Class E vacuolar protein-sorting machinery protein HSE1 n=1 Tax=Thelephora terrestris TaxID=56493 RepID=A0A9P6HE44_9AGAM|nr:hypothetical protein BJ322DRAFT_1124074 [Thelephora terrestris]